VKGQVRGLPGIEAAQNVAHVLEPGTLQKAARNCTAVPAFAVNGDWNIAVGPWDRLVQII
jgi:hypothetical protein